jgi:PhnB protein
MPDQPQFAPIEVYLTVRGGDAASKFYQRAFGATETFRALAEDQKRLMHCNLSVFGGQIMLSDEFPEHGGDTQSPLSRGGASVTININLTTAAEADRIMAQAAKAGAHITMSAADQFWGAHYGRLLDPFGHAWSFSAPAAKKQT